MTFCFYTVISIFGLSSVATLALPNTPVLKSDKLTQHVLNSPSSEFSAAAISLEQSQFLSEPTNASNQSARGSVGLRLLHMSGKTYIKKAEAYGEYVFSEGEAPYLSVPELYIESQYNSPLFFNIGRKKRLWSRMDEEWDLGLWQPLARWDYFKPESQGLIGLGFGAKTTRLGFEVLLSPLFVPDHGPQFELEDGQFQSNNRWFWRPQTELAVFNQSSNLRYRLFKPSEEEVISQFSGALRLWAGDAGQTPWVSASYGYKPVNQFHLAIDPNYLLSDNEIEVAIYPEVIHHHIATLEAGIGERRLSAWVSATQEWPEQREYPATYIHSPNEQSFFASAAVSHEIGFRDFLVTWSYLRRWEQSSRQEEGLVDAGVESSYGRFPIVEAMSVKWRGTLFSKGATRLSWRNQYWYSVDEQGSWLSTGLDLQTSADLLWRLEADILGTSLPENNTQGLVSRYRNNDRILGGIRYVF